MATTFKLKGIQMHDAKIMFIPGTSSETSIDLDSPKYSAVKELVRTPIGSVEVHYTNAKGEEAMVEVGAGNITLYMYYPKAKEEKLKAAK